MKKQTAAEIEKKPEVPRNPSPGDRVLISFGVTNHLCEVEYPLQLHWWLSPDGHVAVVVKEYPGKIYPHKSKGDGAPYWEWPA